MKKKVLEGNKRICTIYERNDKMMMILLLKYLKSFISLK